MAQSKQKPEQTTKTQPLKRSNKIGVSNAAATVKKRLTATAIESPLSVIISA